MGILGIRNRTEDWKTAITFAPFFECDSARTRLANRLLEPLGEYHEVQPGTAKIELFWYGMRDYVHKLRQEGKDIPKLHDFVDRYDCLFPCLDQRIEKARQSGLKLNLPNCWNYNPKHTKDRADDLYKNLLNTEIDIVLQTPNHLFIGEAKHESGLGADGKLILVHQLIRQYVMARILVDFREFNGCRRKEVVPFIVADKETNMKDKHQVRFMRDHERWLHKKNILSWNCIDKIAKSAPADN